ncbi:IS66-like element accessory protein TnpA [Caldimonas brevitalea]|uniref:Transposase n=1 Tax=Caldimonas brevitalea TaxID=413882 RepID=A0A0G3BKK9_9BURK|nr:transposase [Caldimonas brevitalea]AKJ27080.1 hypothetical protein AAW51_0389 [Caldimonas brevitalea]
MNTELEDKGEGRRRRRRHSAEFKAEVVAACQHTGVSIAAVALSHGLNANLVRRWVEETERGPRLASALAAPPAADKAATFVPLKVEQPSTVHEIRVEFQRGQTFVKVSWPSTAAGECAAWLRELLR